MHAGPLLGVGKLLFILLLCGGLLALGDNKLFALLALAGCLFFLF